MRARHCSNKFPSGLQAGTIENAISLHLFKEKSLLSIQRKQNNS
jgi:hypothetical protein